MCGHLDVLIRSYDKLLTVAPMVRPTTAERTLLSGKLWVIHQHSGLDLHCASDRHYRVRLSTTLTHL